MWVDVCGYTPAIWVELKIFSKIIAQQKYKNVWGGGVLGMLQPKRAVAISGNPSK